LKVKELLFGKDSPGFAGCRFGDMTGFLVAEGLRSLGYPAGIFFLSVNQIVNLVRVA
jgi:hypothetical protein